MSLPSGPTQFRHLASRRALVVLPTPRTPVKRKACAIRPARDGVRERARDVVLPDQVLEGLRAVLASENEVAHAPSAYNARERKESCRRVTAASGALRLQLLDELRHRDEEVLHEAVVGDLEDRRVGVLVDRDDDLRALHAGDVLDGARDADRDVELRRDRAARLPDLELGRGVPRVAGGAARADGGAERRRPAAREPA